MVSADRGLQTWSDSRLQSVASWSWYSSSQVDLMLISRKRANSFELAEPHPSTILNAMDSAAFTIWVFRDPRSLRGNFRTARRTFNTCSCALCHTSSRRKSCILTFSPPTRPTHHPFPATPRQSFRARLLTTTDNCPTDQLSTQNLDPLCPTSNFLMRDLARIQ